MKTYLPIIRQITTLFIISFFMLTLSCSDDPSSPKKEDDPIPEETINVGTEGGIVEKGNLKLAVPASAFDANYGITIVEEADDGTFGQNNTTSIFKVKGIPGNYGKPIKISIKKSSETSADESLLALGQNHFDTEEISYFFLDSSDSNEIVEGELSPTDYDIGKNNLSKTFDESHIDFFVRIVQGYGSLTSDKNHFMIYYPSDWNLTRVIEFGNYLEEAYQKIFNLGFRYDARTNWPLKVVFKEITDGSDALTSNSWFGNNYGYIDFNINLLNDMSLAHVTAGHEFFHIVQYLYDTRYGITKSAYASIFHWLNEATGAWIEEKFSNNTNYIPGVREKNKMTPFAGLQMDPGKDESGKVRDFINHGYGLSALIKYLVAKFGEGVLVDIYNDIKDGKHPVDAACRTEENRLGEFEYPVEWWEDFLKEYILGNVYSDVSINDWKKNSTGNFEILTDKDLSRTFTNNYQDLSGKLFTVSLKYPGINQNSKIVFDVTGANKKYLTLFKYNNMNIEYLGTDYNKIVVSDIKTLTQNGWNFLALVSNNRYSKPYTGKDEITLNIKVEESVSNDLSGFNKCNFGLEFKGHFKRTDKDGISEYDRDLDWNWYIFSATGKFSGNTFSGSLNERSGEFIGSIEVTLNESHDTIKNFIWTFEYSPSINYKANYYVSGSDIPSTLLDLNDYDYRFGMYFDNTICEHLSKVEYKSTDIESYTNTPITIELMNPSCDNYSNIYISFGKK